AGGDSAGYFYNRGCWVQPLLPYLEQQNLFAKIDAFEQANVNNPHSVYQAPGHEAVVPTLTCPSDRGNPKVLTYTQDAGGSTPAEKSQGFHGNYVLCSGSTEFFNSSLGLDGTNLNGMFYVQSAVRIPDVAD